MTSDHPKPAPIRDLIDHWQRREASVGLGKGGSYGRHAKVFAELLARANDDAVLARRAIDLFFEDRRAYHVETGWSVAAFQSRASGYVIKARGVYIQAFSPQSALERHNLVAGAEALAQAEARRIAAENARRAAEREVAEKAVPCPPYVRQKMRDLFSHLDVPPARPP